MVDKEVGEERPFDMTLATLERIHNILTEIKNLSLLPSLSQSNKQSIKVGLVKQLFVNSVMELPSEWIESKIKEILELTENYNILKTKTDYGESENSGFIMVFDRELDKKLDEYCIEIQLKLKKEMSKGSKLGKQW